MSFIKNRNLVLIALLIVTVLLYFAPKKSYNSVEKLDQKASLADVAVNLTSEQKKVFDALKSKYDKASNNEEKATALNEIVAFFEQRKLPLQAAVYYAQLAEIINNQYNWITAGDMFKKAANFVNDTLVVSVFESAISAYEKALALAPDNNTAKVKLGVCFVELGQDPMKGVTLLREVAQSDPKNIDAQLNLGFFSVKSNQFDKAIGRFENILKIDSTFADAYVYLANTYEMMADTTNAVKNYEIYSNKVNDTLVSNQVKNYIKKLKKTKN